MAEPEEGDWDQWLGYFLTGVIRQSEDALLRAERINVLIGNWQGKIPRQSPAVAHQLAGLLAGNPFITVRHAEALLAEPGVICGHRQFDQLVVGIGSRLSNAQWCGRTVGQLDKIGAELHGPVSTRRV